MAEPTIDPITLSVLKGRLEQIADEMDATLFRSAFNPIIAEAHDASHGIYHAATGETLIQGKSGLPIFVGAMAFAVKLVIDRYGSDLHEGDVFIFNDPYEGGTHLSDIKLVQPFYYRGQLVCHLASVGHWHDVGGNVAGNYNPVASECFQEGILIPPVRLFSRGELREDIIDILRANSRLPESAYGDLNGQINALELGCRRLTDLIDDYGLERLQAAFKGLWANAATLMRTRIAALPDGLYSAEDFMDNDGTADVPLRIALDIRIKGERMSWDFSRCAPACSGPINISRSTTIAGCYVAIKHLFPGVPANAGLLEPIDFDVPEGSILDARWPRPVGGYTETVLRIIDVVFQAFGEIDQTLTTACAYGTINALSLSGKREDGKPWVMFSFFGGGHGAHAEGDGLNHGNAPISTATIPPLEVLESLYPIRFTAWALRPDSGGTGCHRGGLGAIYEMEILAPDATLSLFGERGRFRPPGVAGGAPGALNRFYFETDEGFKEPSMASKILGVRLKRGQRLRLETPGGGGFGDASLRNPEAIRRDRYLGYTTDREVGSDTPAARLSQSPGA